ncbi:putative malate dehydrogenase 1B [Diabrotica virgifera virgifera]|uniref:Malate dehydrogenase 1B n=1 Tax=Diabrotica virgifera virgifera TaxID=50390 RepID=A0ABM5KHK1_DIAVI|nr:putative malate dehydrogenase 1B [Diabrotica virgifera virgifera]
MPYFVINGKPSCPNFVHAIYVAQYLADKLPNFVFKKVEKLSMEWAIYLEQLNKENKWYVSESPLIWKEINMWGGKKHLIGGLSEFWEHVYCYYGLESLISKQELEFLAADNLKFFKENMVASSIQDVQVIAILGASSPITSFLILELVEIKSLWKSQGIIFKLYDYHQTTDGKKLEITTEYVMYLNSLKRFGKHEMVYLCEHLKEVIQDADIVIDLEDFLKHDVETEAMFLNRCSYRMRMFAELLNHVAKRSVKVIMATSGPVCFMTSCIVATCRRKKLSNIVAVTADKAFPYITSVSKNTGVPVDRISAPAVWGFVGMNQFVDVRNIVYKAEMYRPFKRSLTAPKDTSLPLGTVHTEIRIMSYMLKSVTDISDEVEEHNKRMFAKIHRPPIYSKVRATVSLLKLWSASEIGDEIISLGVASNGSFNIPKGIVFSQPVKLDHNRKWIPYSKFPLMNDVSRSEIKKCYTSIHSTLVRFGLLENAQAAQSQFDTEEEYDAYERYLQGVGVAEEQSTESSHTDLTQIF